MWKTLIIISASIVAVLILAKLLFPKSSKAASLKAVDLADKAKEKIVEAKNSTVQKIADLDQNLATKLS